MSPLASDPLRAVHLPAPRVRVSGWSPQPDVQHSRRPARPHHHLVTEICVTFIKTLKLYLEALELLCLFEGFNGKCHVQVCQQIPGGSRLRLSALVRLRAPGLGLSGQQLWHGPEWSPRHTPHDSSRSSLHCECKTFRVVELLKLFNGVAFMCLCVLA